MAAQIRSREASRRWLVPLLLAAMVAGLLLAAYLLGRAFSDQLSAADVAEEPNGVALGDDSGTPAAGTGAPDDAGTAAPAGDADAYQGAVESVQPVAVTATCTYPHSVDAAGNPVSYPPAQVADGDLSTAWRCAGDGVGERLTLQLPAATRVAEVGLVPGYAKTDPRNGVDRYAENNRVTEVRWRFDDGTEVVHRLDGSAGNRDLQTLRIPVTETGTVVLEILASTPGPRNTVAISEIRLAAAAG